MINLRPAETALSAVTGGLGPIAIKIIGGALISGIMIGGPYLKGRSDGKAACIKKNIKTEAKLDKKEDTIIIDTTEIAEKLNEKVKIRVNGVTNTQLERIEKAAKKEGYLLGVSDGHKKGFEDAKAIPNTCINDPAYLPDSLRDDARHRYQQIYGGTEDARSAPRRSAVPSDTEGHTHTD